MGAGGQDQAVGGDRLAASTGPVDVAAHDVDAHVIAASIVQTWAPTSTASAGSGGGRPTVLR